MREDVYVRETSEAMNIRYAKFDELMVGWWSLSLAIHPTINLQIVGLVTLPAREYRYVRRIRQA